MLHDNTQHPLERNIHVPAGFEPAIPASKRQQTHALGRAATGIGLKVIYTRFSYSKENTLLLRYEINRIILAEKNSYLF